MLSVIDARKHSAERKELALVLAPSLGHAERLDRARRAALRRARRCRRRRAHATQLLVRRSVRVLRRADVVAVLVELGDQALWGSTEGRGGRRREEGR